ncbi:DUF1351 domain-containing protein [Thermophilibacter sp.]|uniref:DUF1351 domain-containing protein n=1 Tax=Thermophilibacter sp. TaxID=2847309 RepID=UPI003A906F8B
MEDKTIDVEAEVIDAPAALTEADRWLAEQRERVEARAKDFEAFDITTPEQYRDAKAQRKALRALIAEVDGDKKRMTKQLRDTLTRFNGEVSAILAGLQAEDAQYKSELDRWERQAVLDRDARVEARYRDEWPDLAAQVPYARLRERFGAEWKADNYGTKEAAIWKGVEQACEAVSADVDSLRAQTHVDGVELTEDDRRDLMADYLRTLDQRAAIGACISRVRQREALRRAEEDRRAWEAEQAARQAAIEYDAAASPEPGPVPAPVAPEEAPEAEGAQTAQQAREVVYVYEVEVPERVKPDFVATMKRLGTHGRLLRKE